MGVRFKYTVGEQNQILDLRLNPTQVNWNYNMNTNIIDTYGGQVVQILSVNIDELIIKGQFGREGVFGAKDVKKEFIDRTRFKFPFDGVAPKDKSEQWDNTEGRLGVGLTQMTTYFREYFARSSQGGDSQASGNSFIETPMSLDYMNRHWPEVVPIQFPSYKRSKENFAPEWQITFKVIEADSNVSYTQKVDAIARLQKGIGFRDKNPYSEVSITNSERDSMINEIVGSYKKLVVPGFTLGELRQLIDQGVSYPNTPGGHNA